MEQLQSHIWLTVSSYMGKYLRNSSYIRKPFLVRYMTLQLLHSEFPYLWGKYDFLLIFFISAICQLFTPPDHPICQLFTLPDHPICQLFTLPAWPSDLSAVYPAWPSDLSAVYPTCLTIRSVSCFTLPAHPICQLITLPDHLICHLLTLPAGKLSAVYLASCWGGRRWARHSSRPCRPGSWPRSCTPPRRCCSRSWSSTRSFAPPRLNTAAQKVTKVLKQETRNNIKEPAVFRIRSVCFWAHWILPSTSKKIKKNLDFYCFVTSVWLIIFEAGFRIRIQEGKNYPQK